MKAMILAAGRGERMRPLTDDLPKPMLQVNGEPLLHYHLTRLAAAGITEVVINLAWQGDAIRTWLRGGERYGLTVACSEEPPGALETGGGIFQALPLLGDAPFWLVNGDVYAEFPFPGRSLAGPDLAHLVLVPNPVHHPRGDFCLRDGRAHATGPGRLTYSGLALLSPRLFTGCSPGRFPLAPLLLKAMQRGLVSAENYPGRWTDVGTPERLAELDAWLAQAR
jgi:MurNAc alpha-1-phosphate uridylyltransferase